MRTRVTDQLCELQRKLNILLWHATAVQMDDGHLAAVRRRNYGGGLSWSGCSQASGSQRALRPPTSGAQVLPYGEHRRLHARGEVELAQDVLHVDLDRGLSNVQFACDQLVAVAAGNQRQDLAFAG